MTSVKYFTVLALLFGLNSVLHAQPTHMKDYHQPPSTATSNSRMDRMHHMDEQLEAMNAMHLKMTEAKTDAERQGLMKEHQKIMSDSMAMMDHSDTSQMPCMASGAHHIGAKKHHQAYMDKHMKMMQGMMQMMRDGMPVPSTP